jgi:hypothetical protein
MVDPRYVEHNISSRNSSLSINNGKIPYPQHYEDDIDDLGEEELVIHKVKPEDVRPIRAKPSGPQDFSVTENYFNNRPALLSPRMAGQSQTLEAWGSPSKHSRFKLSQFTSEKKVRKEAAPRDQL